MEGRLNSSREVQEEILYVNEACAWLNSKEPIQKVVAHLTARYHNHDKPDEGINGANALVIGLAEALVTPLSE